MNSVKDRDLKLYFKLVMESSGFIKQGTYMRVMSHTHKDL